MEAEERRNGIERVMIRKTPMHKWRRRFRGMQATVVRFPRTPLAAEERGDPKRVTPCKGSEMEGGGAVPREKKRLPQAAATTPPIKLYC